MRKSFWLEILFTAIAFIYLAQLARQETKPLPELALNQPLVARHIKLVDAQTLLVELTNKHQLCLVLNGINTPNKYEKGYLRSLLGLMNLVENQHLGNIKLVLDKKINNQLWLGSLYSQQDAWLNLHFIYLGYAWPNTYISDDIEKSQLYERNAKLGVQEAKSLALGHWAGIHINELPTEPKYNYYDLLFKTGHSSQDCWESN